MRISYQWLSDLVDLSGLGPDDVARTLTQLGLEVETTESVAPIDRRIVVAEVVQAVQHPNADTLRACQVRLQSGEVLPVVCGAPNVRAGLRIAFSPVGSVLPDGTVIKASKIRGEVSQGMICSERELGLSDEHQGILELPAATSVGQAVVDALGLSDTVLTLNVTPNRGDCLGILGVARELGAKLQRKLTPDVVGGRSLGLPIRDTSLVTGQKISVRVTTSLCSRFVALYCRGVPKGPSPLWMQRRLVAAGLRPINWVVDATNYVCIERGQPIHAYDLRRLGEPVLEAREARAGERLTTLDGVERELIAGEIVIANGRGVLGLAGVMGGQSSEIREDTDEIVIEAAAFDGGQVHRTARRLGLHTEASHRFERGVDPGALEGAVWRVGSLLQAGEGPGPGGGALATVQVAATLADTCGGDGKSLQPRRIAVRGDRAAEVLGLPARTVQDALVRLGDLGFGKVDQNGERWLLEVPTWRHDIVREIDVIEEIGRFVGYDKIPYQLPPWTGRGAGAGEQGAAADRVELRIESLKITMAHSGFAETVSFPFVGREQLEGLGLRPEGLLEVLNPLAATEPFLRASLVPSLLQQVAANRRRGSLGTRLFECGRVFSGVWGNQSGLHLTARARGERRPHERLHLGAVADAPWRAALWQGAEVAADFYQMKAVLGGLERAHAMAALSFVPPTQESGAELPPYLNPRRSAVIHAGSQGVPLGWVGELDPGVADRLDLDCEAVPVVFEIDIEAWTLASRSGSASRGEMSSHRVVCRFPTSTRDLAFVVARSTPHATFEAAIARYPKRKHLRHAQLFDVYQGPHVGPAEKSLGYRFVFQSADRTLQEAEVEAELGDLRGWIEGQTGARLRS